MLPHSAAVCTSSGVIAHLGFGADLCLPLPLAKLQLLESALSNVVWYVLPLGQNADFHLKCLAPTYGACNFDLESPGLSQCKSMYVLPLGQIVPMNSSMLEKLLPIRREEEGTVVAGSKLWGRDNIDLVLQNEGERGAGADGRRLIGLRELRPRPRSVFMRPRSPQSRVSLDRISNTKSAEFTSSSSSAPVDE